ncbi:MAG: hypothetical protein HQL72_00540 [Magnetococcales bacterium]|nr:hypothetical protein [Magnetococcales bacterium]
MSATPPLTVKRKMQFIGFLVTISVLIALLLGELYIRWNVEYLTPEILRDKSLQYEPALFSRHFIKQRSTTIRFTSSQPFEYRINALGYRGPDFLPDKPEGTLRILIYGGSQVFNGGGNRDNDWPRQIERAVRASGYPNVEVINAGIPGLASFDSVGRLFSEGHQFHPDIVVLCNGWNDIKYFHLKTNLFRHYKPKKASDSDHVRYNYVNGLDRFLSEHSQLYVQLRDRFVFWWFGITAEGVINQVDGSNPPDKEIPPYSLQQSALNQYRLNIETFVDLANNIGAVPVLVKQARLAHPDNSEAEKKRISYTFLGPDPTNLLPEMLPKIFGKIDEIITSVADRKGALVLDPSQKMSGKGDYFSDHIHFSAQGTAEMARILSAGLLPVVERLSFSGQNEAVTGEMDK